MMALHSGDTSAVTLVPDTSTQWRTIIFATIAVSRMQRSQTPWHSAREQALAEPEETDPESLNQNGSSREDDVLHSQASHDEGANEGAQLDPDALDRISEDKHLVLVESLKLIRDELVKQLDAYGLVLVLLAGITFVAILQPPGSFDHGKLQESLLVSLFMLLATLSFFIACTGLGAVMVGCAQLFRPFFHPKLVQVLADAVRESRRLLEVGNLRNTAETPAGQEWFRKWFLGCCKDGSNFAETIDDINVLANLCLENVYSVRRIRIYLGVALVLCIAAYICGALAVMVTNDRQRHLLIGAMAAGCVIVLFEICITVSAAVKPVSESNNGTLPPELIQALRNLSPMR